MAGGEGAGKDTRRSSNHLQESKEAADDRNGKLMGLFMVVLSWLMLTASILLHAN